MSANDRSRRPPFLMTEHAEGREPERGDAVTPKATIVGRLPANSRDA